MAEAGGKATRLRITRQEYQPILVKYRRILCQILVKEIVQNLRIELAGHFFVA
jgi:hypothetical protein